MAWSQKGKHRGTSNVGFIHGGEATNVVTDRVTLKAEARSHDPKFRGKIVKEIETSLRKRRQGSQEAPKANAAACESKAGSITNRSRSTPKSRACSWPKRPSAAVGREPVLAISNGGLDANWLNAHGIPTVTLGCGQMNVHMTSEMLDLAAYRDACRIALRLATGA